MRYRIFVVVSDLSNEFSKKNLLLAILMLDAPVFRTRVKFVGNSAVCYSSAVDAVGKRKDNGSNLLVDRQKAYKGSCGGHKQKVIKERLSGYLNSLREGNLRNGWVGSRKEIKVVLLTVTLSATQFHTDGIIKSKILNPFLKHLVRVYGCENYFWRAESQQNGNIHFHILLDRFLDKKKVQEVWNAFQNKLGYVDRFYDKFQHASPPSTDVRLFDFEQGGIDYLVKYLSKKPEYRAIEGLQFRFSNKLTKFRCQFYELPKSEENGYYDYFEHYCVDKFENEHCTVFYFDCDPYRLFNVSKTMRSISLYNRLMFDACYVFRCSVQELNLVNYLFVDKWKFRALYHLLRNYMTDSFTFDALCQHNGVDLSFLLS